MPQIFPKWVNNVPLYAAAAVPLGAVMAVAFVWYYFSPEYTDVGYRPVQPVPFSHKLHAGDMEMDCRYCHAQVERAAVASVPPSQVCMNCHSLVLRDSPFLVPILDSVTNDHPMRWVRVHKTPEYAYFHHGAHVRAGVGCQSCHGDIRSMEVVTQQKPLSMSWCLDCHRNPDMHLRPPEELTNTKWTPPEDQLAFAETAKAERHINPPEDCSGCHR